MNQLKIKEPDDTDLPIIDYLNKQQIDFKLDDLNNRIVHRLVFDGTVPIAYGIVKRMAEAILIVNHDSPKMLRARAMRELMQYAEHAAKVENCQQLHCFVSDVNLARLLEKQYNFIKTNDIVLVKNL